MELESKIEGVLFYKAEPMTKQELGSLFSVDEHTINMACDALHNSLQDRNGGVRLMITTTDVQLVTAPELSETIDLLRKEELKRDIGKAGAETLAIILYRGPVTRAEIDMIRGVNSTFILRNLLIRGLIDRIAHPTDKRQFQYQITTNLLAHLGITKKEELPDFATIADEIERYEKEHHAQNETEQTELNAQ